MYTTYVLLLDKTASSDVTFGRRTIWVPRGAYLYVGSAKRALASRVERHLRKAKHERWHIDYLTVRDDVAVRAVFLSPESECETFQTVVVLGQPFGARLGSSDCRCPSHFVRTTGKDRRSVPRRLRGLGLVPYRRTAPYSIPPPSPGRDRSAPLPRRRS